MVVVKTESVKKKKTTRFKKANHKIKMISFPIVGISYLYKNQKRRSDLLDSLKVGSRITIKHEIDNKVDSNACAIYFKNKKIGYVSRLINHKLIRLAQNNTKIDFFIGSNLPFPFFEEGLVMPVVIALYK